MPWYQGSTVRRWVVGRRRVVRRMGRPHFRVGEHVEYLSQTFGGWIEATVERVHHDNTITLDVKEYADPSRVRRLGLRPAATWHQSAYDEHNQSAYSDRRQNPSPDRGFEPPQQWGGRPQTPPRQHHNARVQRQLTYGQKQQVHQARAHTPDRSSSRAYNARGSGHLRGHGHAKPPGKHGLIKPSTVECSGDYRDCDEAALSAKGGQHWRSVRELAKSLTAPFSGDHEKMARALFRWVTHNVAYDLQSLRRGNITHESCQADYVMRHGRAVCSGYASLLCALCDAVGIPCKKISGTGRDPRDEGGDGRPDGHAWNALSFDGGRGWHLCDPCWAAGACNSTFTRCFDKKWWCSPPQHFLETHLPNKSADQLLDRPVSKAEWRSLPDTAWTPKTFGGMNDGDEVLSPSTGTLRRGQTETFKIFIKEDRAALLYLQWGHEQLPYKGQEEQHKMSSKRVNGGYEHSETGQVRGTKVTVLRYVPTKGNYESLAEWAVIS